MKVGIYELDWVIEIFCGERVGLGVPPPPHMPCKQANKRRKKRERKRKKEGSPTIA